MKGNKEVIIKIIEYSKYFPNLTISSITHYEILSGLHYKNAVRQINDFERLLTRCNILNIDTDSIKISSIEFGKLKRKGITIGNSDILIAGIALKHKLTLSTNNFNHFKYIDNLEIVNWKNY